MLRSPRPVLLIGVILSSAIGPSCRAEDPSEKGGGPETPEAAALFDQDRVIEVSVELSEEDWDTIRRQTRSFVDVFANLCGGPVEDVFTTVPAQVTVDGVTLEEVGVRKKGFLGSLDDNKPSLKFSFDEYVEGQFLHGLERLTLNNNKQDPSHVRQCLAYQVFSEAGVPASRCNFAHVTVNGRDMGLFTHVEEVKKPFLRRHFEDDEGQLYEGTISDFTETGKLSFEQKTNEEVLYNRGDIDAVQQALADESGGLFGRLEGLIDMDRFVKLWVTETIVSHWDGYANNQNNFYLYNDPTTGRFVFIPWGVDGAFSPSPTILDFGPESDLVFSKSLLTNRGYNDPEIRERYLQRLQQALASWNVPALLAELDRMEALLTPFADSNLSSAIDEVREFVQYHVADLNGQLQNGPPTLQEGYEGCE
jgi:spore coat protein H